MRKSFILHKDSLAVVKELTIEQKADFLDAIVDYQNGDEIKLTGLMKAVFLPFKNQFDRDNEKYFNEVKVSSDKGKLGNLKRWHTDLYTKVIENQLDIEEAIAIAKHRPPIVSDAPRTPPIPKSLDSKSKSKSKKNNNNIIVSEFDKQIRSEGKQFFLNCYQSKTGSEFYWEVKDATALISLLKKISAKVREKFPHLENESAEFGEKLLSGYQIILTNIKDNWILERYSLTIINSKFNEIYSQITTKTHDTNSITDLINFAVGTN
jgi:hypothetical protein